MRESCPIPLHCYNRALIETDYREIWRETRWSLLGCVLIHRVGVVAVGDAIVLVGTAASHRAEALEACAYLIDRLKTDAPFWKKEHRIDGSALWVEAKASDDLRAGKWANPD